MKLRDEFRQLFGFTSTSNSRSGVLNTGQSLDELKAAYENRWNVMDRIEQKADNELEKEKTYRKKAKSEDGHRKLKFFSKAEIRKEWRNLYEKLYENMLAQQLTLTELLLTAEKKNLSENPMQELGLDFDMEELDAQAIGNALEETEFDDAVVQDLGDLEVVTEVHGDSNLPGLEEMKENARHIDSDELEALSSSEFSTSMENRLDEELDKELDALEDGSVAGGD